MVLLLALNPILTNLLVVLFLFICVVLILTILIQRPAGGGLSGAFGSGAGSGQTAFGAKTGDALTIATVTMFFIYILAAIGLNFATRPGDIVTVPTATGTNGDAAPTQPETPAPPAGADAPAEGQPIDAAPAEPQPAGEYQPTGEQPDAPAPEGTVPQDPAPTTPPAEEPQPPAAEPGTGGAGPG